MRMIRPDAFPWAGNPNAHPPLDLSTPNFCHPKSACRRGLELSNCGTIVIIAMGKHGKEGLFVEDKYVGDDVNNTSLDYGHACPATHGGEAVPRRFSLAQPRRIIDSWR